MENNQKGDLISRKALIEELKEHKYLVYNNDSISIIRNHEIERCISIVEDAPPVDAYEQGYTDGWKERFGEPDGRPKGDWVITKLQHGEDVTCPFCTARPRRSEYGYYLHDNYCPECGADLRKDKSSGGI